MITPPAAPRPMPEGFAPFWAGQTLAQLGTQMGQVALPVVAVQVLSARAADLGYLNAAQTAAFLLVGLPAGAWVDRWLKRPTMVAADAVRCSVMLVLPLLWFAGVLQMWHLVVGALVVGLASVFFEVAYQSYVPILVPDDQVGTANARLETSFQVARLAGPALGGLLLKVVSAPLVLAADALGYLASVLFLLRTRDREAAERGAADPVERRPLWHEIGEGLGFVWRTRAIRQIATSTMISNLTSTAVFTLAPLLYLDLMGLDPFTYGLTLTAGAVGGLLGAAGVPWLRRRLPDSTLIPGGMVVASLGMALQPLAWFVHPRPLAAALVCVGGFVSTVGVLVYNICQVTMRQRLCPRRLLGRMNASIRFVIWGVMPLSALAAGWLGQRHGVLPVMLGACALAFLAYVPLIGIGRHLPPREDAASAAG